jgi:Translation elongation factor Ts
MSQVTASLVKESREKTGVGMLDCKPALKENNGDIEASLDWLRTKGIAKVAKTEGRIASEGLIAVEKIDNTASIIEVNSDNEIL